MNSLDTKVLLVSGSGFLGSHLLHSLPSHFSSLHYSSRTNSESKTSAKRFHLHLDQPIAPKMENLLRKNSFSLGIICAAVSDPEQCFLHPEFSHRVNVTATQEMVDLFCEFGIKTIFFSSDLVFGGQKDLCTETESTCPTTLYGKQKVLAEEYVLGKHPTNLVLRVSKLMSTFPHPRNPLNPILEALCKNKETKLFFDQFTTPLFIEDIAKAVFLASQRKLNGIYHLGMDQKFSRLEVGMLLSELLKRNPKYLIPSRMAEHPFREYRGPTNTLNSRKFELATDFRFRRFSDSITEIKKNFLID